MPGVDQIGGEMEMRRAGRQQVSDEEKARKRCSLCLQENFFDFS